MDEPTVNVTPDVPAPNIGTLVIFQSPNGMDHWTPVLPADVPAWVKDPDNVARLVDGEACSLDPEAPDAVWYMALQMPTEADLQAYSLAAARRAKRRSRLVMH